MNPGHSPEQEQGVWCPRCEAERIRAVEPEREDHLGDLGDAQVEVADALRDVDAMTADMPWQIQAAAMDRLIDARRRLDQLLSVPAFDADNRCKWDRCIAGWHFRTCPWQVAWDLRHPAFTTSEPQP